MQVFAVTKSEELLRDFEFAENVREHLAATELVFVVPGRLVNAFERAYAARPFCAILDEREALDLTLSDVQKWDVFGFPERAGWYYQQLLKLGVAALADAQPRYLVWDADTIPYRAMRFFDHQKLIFTAAHEYHLPYFATNEALIGANRAREGLRFSAVSQHMPVDRDMMLALLRALGRDHEGDWAAAIRTSVSGGRSGPSLFSEYELFSDWVRRTSPDRFALRTLTWSRHGNRFDDRQLALAKRCMHFIAFEAWDVGRHRSLSRSLKLWREVFVASLQIRWAGRGAA